MATVPNYIKVKVTKMNRLATKLVELNMELEAWLESRGIEDGWDFIHSNDYAHESGYEIMFEDRFYKQIEDVIGK